MGKFHCESVESIAGGLLDAVRLESEYGTIELIEDREAGHIFVAGKDYIATFRVDDEVTEAEVAEQDAGEATV
jgi:hypothetical protein